MMITSIKIANAMIDQLRAENATLVAALVAKDEVIAKMCAWHELQATWDKGDNGYYKAKQILALQPHAALVAKLKTEAVREAAAMLGGEGEQELLQKIVPMFERGEV